MGAWGEGCCGMVARIPYQVQAVLSMAQCGH